MREKVMDDLNQAADDVRDAAGRFAERLMGSDVHGHLRDAARHLLHAARSVLEEAESCLDKGAHAAQADSADASADKASDANAG
jgi:hypothetical protein